MPIVHYYTTINNTDNGIVMADLSYEGLNGTSCNLSVAATTSVDQCFEDIEIDNISKQICSTSYTQSHNLYY